MTNNDNATGRKLHLPRIRRVTLRNFSLFSRLSKIEVEFPDGVFCLAGANGLGKSTFLCSVNYALTGIVPDPGRKFESVEEFSKDNAKFSNVYFEGRIEEYERDAAEVTVEMYINNYSIRVTRGIFDNDELRELDIVGVDYSFTGEGETSEARYKKYIEFLTKQIGLDSFEQFVFLQHMVLTFDERRHLLFWDQKVLEQALYLAFGVDPAAAKRADFLRRDFEKADSLVRNSQWQASEIRKKIREVEALLDGTYDEKNPITLEDLEKKHVKLTEEVEAAQLELDSLSNKFKDAHLRVAELTARQAGLRLKYEECFSKRIEQQFALIDHPLISSSINDCQCGLCGTRGEKVAKSIRARVQEASCPLCGSDLSQEASEPVPVEELRRLGAEVEEVTRQLNEVVHTQERIQVEITHAYNSTESKRAQLSNFQRDNEKELSLLFSKQNFRNDSESVLGAFRAQLEDAVQRKEKQTERREARRKDRTVLQRSIELAYYDAQEDFVPRFRDLAKSFLGLDLTIRMEARPASGLNLILGVKETIRRQDHQLSESQRFFVDIALRMALAQHMSALTDKATLFVDTPEGSLDIAYESRAGDMFARFIEDHYHLVMTANINSSQLLLRLAERCGHSRLSLQKMTNWTELSDVQMEEEHLFTQALDRIDKAQSSAVV